MQTAPMNSHATTTPSGQPDFFARTRGARKVMVLDLGFVGDTVHLLPALWTIRQGYPKAELHVMVAEHVTSLMEVTPWVDRVWGYPRFPKHASLGRNISTVRDLRKERFDVVINLNGSDRSSWLTFLSGAPERLGRVPLDGGPLFWRSLFSETVAHPFYEHPVYEQRWHCLAKAGFPVSRPEFHIEIKGDPLAAMGVTAADAATYFHVSPFTSSDQKELPPEQTVQLLASLAATFPEKKIALSCAPTDRERRKLQTLLKRMPQPPWRSFPGTLTLVQLTALIQKSALNLSGDSGTMHLALMTGVPTVTWWSPGEGFNEWIPVGDRHHKIVGTRADLNGVQGIITADLIAAIRTILLQAE